MQVFARSLKLMINLSAFPIEKYKLGRNDPQFDGQHDPVEGDTSDFLRQNDRAQRMNLQISYDTVDAFW